MLHYAARLLTSRALKIHYFIFPTAAASLEDVQGENKREERVDECLKDEKWCSGERSRLTATLSLRCHETRNVCCRRSRTSLGQGIFLFGHLRQKDSPE